MRRSIGVVWVALLLTMAGVALAGTEKGYFGLTVDVRGSGSVLTPTLEAITIKQVVAGSPAAIAGIVVGDQILEVDGHAVQGSRPDDIVRLMQKQAGQSLTLELRRESGDVYSVTLVAVTRAEIEKL
jgi:C-terminal processing protease CtpA/Prc